MRKGAPTSSVINMPQVDPASLKHLHDIVSAPHVSWWPLAPGWYLLAATLFLALLWLVSFWRCYRRRNAYRRAALAQLDHLELQLHDLEQRQATLRELPELVKRTALAAWPRAEVAGLSGELWLVWLDNSWQRQRFTEGPGRLLPQLSYAAAEHLSALPEAEVAELVAMIRAWILLHQRPKRAAREGQHV